MQNIDDIFDAALQEEHWSNFANKPSGDPYSEWLPCDCCKGEHRAGMCPMRDTVNDGIVRDAAWVEGQKENIRKGGSRKSNEFLQIPKRFLGKNLADYEAPDDFKNKTYTDFLHSNVFFWGPCGTGKTHLSCGLLLNYYADMAEFNAETRSWKRPSARFVSVQEFLFQMKSAIGASESDFEHIKKLLRLDAFVLDDFGASRMTDYAVEMMSVMINEIYLNKLSGVIISSNLSLEEIGQKIDDRTASRIVEVCEVINLHGADRRLASTEGRQHEGSRQLPRRRAEIDRA